MAQTPAAGSMAGGKAVCECASFFLCVRVCVCLKGERGGNEHRNIILRRPLMLGGSDIRHT